MSCLCSSSFGIHNAEFLPAAATVETQTAPSADATLDVSSGGPAEGVRGATVKKSDNPEYLVRWNQKKPDCTGRTRKQQQTSCWSSSRPPTFFVFCVFFFRCLFLETRTMGYCSTTVQSLGMFIFKNHHTVAHSIEQNVFALNNIQRKHGTVRLIFFFCWFFFSACSFLSHLKYQIMI